MPYYEQPGETSRDRPLPFGHSYETRPSLAFHEIGEMLNLTPTVNTELYSSLPPCDAPGQAFDPSRVYEVDTAKDLLVDVRETLGALLELKGDPDKGFTTDYTFAGVVDLTVELATLKLGAHLEAGKITQQEHDKSLHDLLDAVPVVLDGFDAAVRKELDTAARKEKGLSRILRIEGLGKFAVEPLAERSLN